MKDREATLALIFGGFGTKNHVAQHAGESLRSPQKWQTSNEGW